MEIFQHLSSPSVVLYQFPLKYRETNKFTGESHHFLQIGSPLSNQCMLHGVVHRSRSGSNRFFEHRLDRCNISFLAVIAMVLGLTYRLLVYFGDGFVFVFGSILQLTYWFAQ